MKLNRFDRELAVADPHDDAVFGLGCNFEAGWEAGPSGKQRMVTAHSEAIGEALEHAEIAVRDVRSFPMHGVIQNIQFPAERLDNALQTEAYAEDRDAHLCGVPHQIRHAEITGAARTGRDQYQCWRDLLDHLRRDASAVSDDLGSGLAPVVGQGMNEAIVVID